MRISAEIIAISQTVTGLASPLGITLSFVLGFLLSIFASITLLNDIPDVRAAARATVTRTQDINVPPPAKKQAQVCKGKGKDCLFNKDKL